MFVCYGSARCMQAPPQPQGKARSSRQASPQAAVHTQSSSHLLRRRNDGQDLRRPPQHHLGARADQLPQRRQAGGQPRGDPCQQLARQHIARRLVLLPGDAVSPLVQRCEGKSVIGRRRIDTNCHLMSLRCRS